MPGRKLGAQVVGLPEDALSGTLVVPEAGLARSGLELGEALLSGV